MVVRKGLRGQTLPRKNLTGFWRTELTVLSVKNRGPILVSWVFQFSDNVTHRAHTAHTEGRPSARRGLPARGGWGAGATSLRYTAYAVTVVRARLPRATAVTTRPSSRSACARPSAVRRSAGTGVLTTRLQATRRHSRASHRFGPLRRFQPRGDRRVSVNGGGGGGGRRDVRRFSVCRPPAVAASFVLGAATVAEQEPAAAAAAAAGVPGPFRRLTRFGR